MRPLTLLVTIFLAVGSAATGLGSLTREESGWKKTSYSCVIRSIVEDDQGRIYLGTFGSGLWIRTGTDWAQIASSPGGLPDPRISRLLIMGDDLLVATAGGGAARMNRTTGKWSHLLPGDDPPSRHFHAMSPLPDGAYLLGAVGEGLCLSTGTHWIRLSEPEGLPSDWVNDALPDASGTWIGTFDGLAFLEGARITRVELPAGGWKDGNINVLAWFGGRLFLGTASGGLVERTPSLRETGAGVPATSPAPLKKGSPRGARPHYRRVDGVPAQVHALLPVEDSLWIGTEEGLFRLPLGGAAAPVAAPASSPVSVTSLGLSRHGILMGTDVGQLYLLSDKKWICLFDFPSNHGGGKPR